eukprot:gnl/TRDRNA2_/TRDRNA2_74436_c0_seq1.p2 gnl/TRDRNA2_/TRDRNA2_74436_c0~~gnl/TRDRNA2_/TRDRNA2_74436_c0_seq1.p2  ORF type:complete len:143 (-),score=22.46 gnl/TRDRNA2_/TRDRNA2_74436_c0_seq1:241-609(-)
MPNGQMIRWNEDKGFGFIKPDDGGPDIFCHVSSLLDGKDSVRDGDYLKFKVEVDDRKGKDHAVDVEVVGGGGGRRRSRSRSRGRGGGSRGGGGRDRRDRDDSRSRGRDRDRRDRSYDRDRRR